MLPPADRFFFMAAFLQQRRDEGEGSKETERVCACVRVFQTTLLFTYLTDLAPIDLWCLHEHVR